MTDTRAITTNETPESQLELLLNITDLQLIIFAFLPLRELLLLARINRRFRRYLNADRIFEISSITYSDTLSKKQKLISIVKLASNDARKFLLTLNITTIKDLIPLLNKNHNERLGYLAELGNVDPSIKFKYSSGFYSAFPQFLDLVMVGVGLNLFEAKAISPDVRLALMLNYFSLMLLMKRRITFQELLKVDQHNASIFSKEGIALIEDNILPVEFFNIFRPKSLIDILLSRHIQLLLKSKTITVNQLLLFFPNTVMINGTPATIIRSTNDLFDDQRIQFLATANTAIVLKENLITFEDLSVVYCLKGLLSDNGVQALREGLITPQQAKCFKINEKLKRFFLDNKTEPYYLEYTLLDRFFIRFPNSLDILRSRIITIDDLIKLALSGLYEDLDVLMKEEVIQLIKDKIITIDDICNMISGNVMPHIDTSISNDNTDYEFSITKYNMLKDFSVLHNDLYHIFKKMKASGTSKTPLLKLSIVEDEFYPANSLHRTRITSRATFGYPSHQVHHSYFPNAPIPPMFVQPQVMSNGSHLGYQPYMQQNNYASQFPTSIPVNFNLAVQPIPQVGSGFNPIGNPFNRPNQSMFYLLFSTSEMILKYKNWIKSGLLRNEDLNDLSWHGFNLVLQSKWGIQAFEEKLITSSHLKRLQNHLAIASLVTELAYSAFHNGLVSVDAIIEVANKNPLQDISPLFTEKGLKALSLNLISINDVANIDFKDRLDRLEIPNNSLTIKRN